MYDQVHTYTIQIDATDISISEISRRVHTESDASLDSAL